MECPRWCSGDPAYMHMPRSRNPISKGGFPVLCRDSLTSLSRLCTDADERGALLPQNVNGVLDLQPARPDLLHGLPELLGLGQQLCREVSRGLAGLAGRFAAAALGRPGVELLPPRLRAVLAHVLAADHHRGVVLEEVRGFDPEDAVLAGLVVERLLDLGAYPPEVALVAPVAVPLAGAPGIPQLQQVPAGAGHVPRHGQDGVGVPLHDTKLAGVGVAASMRAAAHQVVLGVVLRHKLQDLGPLSAQVPARAIRPHAVQHPVGLAMWV
mmetsp:Transcript_96828/g.289192  ORF Transcript_96828/g.289192 Transcript_96828/m.289192 type:complete len:268 (-) Transcript_96828:891-1694(-)